MIFSSDSFSNKKEKNLSKESKNLDKRNNHLFNSSDNIHNKNTTFTSLSGISVNNEINEKNKFHNNLGRKGISAKALYDARQKIIEKLKNKSKNKDKEISYVLQEKITRNDSDLNKNNISNNSNVSNFNPKRKNSSSDSFKSNKKNDENEKNDINNYKSNNLKKVNKQIKEKDNNNNNFTTQLNVIFPKEKIENKHLKTLREVTEEKTENYVSIEKDINKISELKEKEKIEKKYKKNDEIIKELKNEKKSKSLNNKKNKFVVPENIQIETIVPKYKYIKSLNELNNLSNEEKIEKLYENNINLYEELIELKIKNNKLIEELKRKENKRDDKFKGYLIEENDKLTKKNNENERVIDYLLQRLNINLSKKESKNLSYSDIINIISFYKPKIKKSKVYHNSEIILDDNLKINKNDKFINLSNSNFNSNTICSSNYKKYIKSEKEFSFNDLINNNHLKKQKRKNQFISPSKTTIFNNNEFFDYYGSKGDNRIKTCYACLFGKSNFSKGYSPIICSPKNIKNNKETIL